MRNWLKVGIILMLILMLVVAATGCGKEALGSPEETVNTLLDAYEDMDADKVLDCIDLEAMTEEERQGMEAAMAMMTEMFEFVSITNRDISVVSQTEDTATVSVSFDVKTTVEGETQTTSVDETWTLVKRDDKWLLTESYFESE